jgi:hypothetical protein
MRLCPLVFTFFALAASAVAEEWRIFTDKTGRTVEARVVKVEQAQVLVTLKASGRDARIGFDQLSDEDLAFLREQATSTSAKEDVASQDEPPPGRLYPRTKQEIRSTIREIKGRPKPPDISRDVHEATQELNVFRYLSGLDYDVKASAAFSKNAEEAALACEKHGALSHDIGHYTDKCNLYTEKDMPRSVAAYIEDAGENNREKRGHRAWCLNPPMEKVGFGSGKNGYSAMWCMNKDGKPLRDTWAYPGKGLYPLEYMLGDAWSLYGIEVPGSLNKLEVRVFRLKERPAKPFPAAADVPGREIRVRHVSKALFGGINFEPDEPAQRGVYWVVVRGPGIREAYLVELF